MVNFEEKLIARWPASTFLIAGVVVGLLGYLPLQLYIMFGPRDGNPIGLGLLFISGIPLGAVIFVIGLIKLLVDYFMGRRN
jgi:hypothetical protein